jgi:hypothetical protein
MEYMRANATARNLQPHGDFYAPVESLTQQIARTRADPRRNPRKGHIRVWTAALWRAGVRCGMRLQPEPIIDESDHGLRPRFVPSLVAEHNTGIQRTLLYGRNRQSHRHAVPESARQSREHH